MCELAGIQAQRLSGASPMLVPLIWPVQKVGKSPFSDQSLSPNIDSGGCADIAPVQ